MNRRSLFHGLVACVAASAMEVYGWTPPKLGYQVFKSGNTTILYHDPSPKTMAQLDEMIKNFERNIVDIWEDRDQKQYHSVT